MRKTRCVAWCLLVLLPASTGRAGQAEQLLRSSGVAGGLAVVVDCEEAALLEGLAGAGPFLVHGLQADAAKLAALREQILARGLCGRVSAAGFDGRALPYAADVVNLLIVPAGRSIRREEALRVLVPGGVALLGGERLVKPRPEGMDEWPQYLHGPDNNAVAADRLVGPPRRLQWQTAPAWSRSHMGISTVVAMVSAGGRLFTIEDAATPENPFLPGRFRLVARDAFNGLTLWQRPFADFEPVTRYIKDIAVQLQRRLAADGGAAWCTPGLNAPLTCFDAATGAVRRTLAGTERTQEFALADGVLYAVIGDRMNAARYDIVKAVPGKGTNLGGYDPKAPFGGTGFRGAYAPETPDRPETRCRIVALDPPTGRVLWQRENVRNYVGCTLAIDGGRAVFQTTGGLFCLDARSGREIWALRKAIPTGDGTQPNTLILGGAMVYAQQGRTLHAYDLADGSERWTAPIADNYEKSADLFLVGGLIWTGGSGKPRAFDARTGRPVRSLTQRMNGPMGHDRCYRNFITERYFINSKTGGADFLDLAAGTELPNHWTRGTCGMGVLPCNGLLYAPPYSCQCSVGAMVPGFNALRGRPGLKKPAEDFPLPPRPRLVKGPAWAAELPGAGAPPAGGAEWPTYRHDGSRGAVTPAKVPADLAVRWKARLPAAGTQPVVAGGKVFVAAVDAHTLYALDLADGSVAWRYTAGGRIDTPPTAWRGLLLFGSRDGWVHCLRASDGALRWRFRDLPERLIGAWGGLESAWPVHGSVLVWKHLAYFAAGRSSFLDGGITLYALRPETGQVVHRRRIFGPFDRESGFPAVANRGCLADVLVTDGRLIYMRHRAFRADLSDADNPGPHVLPSAGFLDAVPQHRTYWTIAAGFVGKTTVRGPAGDILATDGRTCYEVRGFPVHRHSYFDPRVKGYRLLAGALGRSGAAAPAPPAKKARSRRRAGRGPGGGRASEAIMWQQDIPLAGHAVLRAGEVLFVAGVPAHFPPDHPVEKYQAAYAGRLGGVLWAAAAADGRRLASRTLPAAAVWDGLAAVEGRLLVSLRDGTVLCFGPAAAPARR